MSGAPGGDSNARRAAYRAAALPTELQGRDPFRLCPSASDRQAGQVLSLHMGGDPVHIPPSPFPRRAHRRWCKGTPEMERKLGIEPPVSTTAWSRSATKLHPHVLRGCRPGPALPRGILLMNVATHAALRRDGRGPGGREAKQKGPDPSGIRASRARSGQDASTRLAVPDACRDRDHHASTASARSRRGAVRTRPGRRPPWRPRRRTHFGPRGGSMSSLAAGRFSRCVLEVFLSVASERRKVDGCGL